jgi:hypothetical protein
MVVQGMRRLLHSNVRRTLLVIRWMMNLTTWIEPSRLFLTYIETEEPVLHGLKHHGFQPSHQSISLMIVNPCHDNDNRHEKWFSKSSCIPLPDFTLIGSRHEFGWTPAPRMGCSFGSQALPNFHSLNLWLATCLMFNAGSILQTVVCHVTWFWIQETRCHVIDCTHCMTIHKFFIKRIRPAVEEHGLL